jgi:hypothetical protein
MAGHYTGSEETPRAGRPPGPGRPRTRVAGESSYDRYYKRPDVDGMQVFYLMVKYGRRLSKRDYRVLAERGWLGVSIRRPGVPYSVLATRLGVTRQRVAQIEAGAVKKLLRFREEDSKGA